MSRYRGIVFDKDGTLVDFQASWVSAGLAMAQHLCARAGAPHRFEEIVDAAGFDRASGRLGPESPWASGTSETLLAGWLERLGLSPALMPQMLRLMCDHATANVTPLADIPALFSRCEASGMAVGIATMDVEDAALRCMERLGVAGRAHFVCGCDSGHGHKPGPGMVLAFCRVLGLSPQDVVVVGDTPHDMHMGRAAGVGRVIGVASGVASGERLAPLADVVVSDVSQLPELLAG